MTVAELIEYLRSLPEDLIVTVQREGFNSTDDQLRLNVVEEIGELVL